MPREESAKNKVATNSRGVAPSLSTTKRTSIEEDGLTTGFDEDRTTKSPERLKEDDNKEEDDESNSTMLLVDNELVLDLTEEQEDYHVVLKRAREEVLNSDIREFTLVSHLSRKFPVRDLAEILEKTNNLRSLSLFSVALSGRTADFDFLAQVLRGHKQLKEVHMVDCGMLGAWEAPPGSESISTSTTSTLEASQRKRPKLSSRAKELATKLKPPPGPQPTTDVSTAAMSTSAKSKTSGATAMSTSGGTLAMSTSSTGGPSTANPSTAAVASSSSRKRTAAQLRSPVVPRSKNLDSSVSASSKEISSASTRLGEKVPTMDAILNALATINTLTNVELYGIPSGKYDKLSDGDQESNHQAVLAEGEGDQDIPMVPMANGDSYTHSDEDFLADYDEDIRGIPGNGRPVCSLTKKLSLLMSPESIGAICRGPNLSQIGFEDLNLQHRHIELIAEALSLKGCKVKELKMWGCNVDDKSSDAIARMLKVNVSLEKLDLSYNHIKDKGCVAIANALRGNTTLRCLNIMGNECAEDYDKESKGGCYEALMDLLKVNATLKDLILEPFEQDDDSDGGIPEFIIIPADYKDDASSASE
ncbi:leucine Rich Repeat [Seminavis robusta]|uniref:Leucine Rich Repeat n=1 Tax=Seminavis robusta TaxID=568900 RepID=A0A9N8DCV3_9STRA|nr:leucine Rich Repeat [Seminavis robusta]|eukprot:Sro65_g036620.1 leucine Rich Repeat (589) ;mRNA; r:29256-31022